MSPEDTRLECLRIAAGDVDAGQKMLEFVYPTANGAAIDRQILQRHVELGRRNLGQLAQSVGATVPVDTPGESPFVKAADVLRPDILDGYTKGRSLMDRIMGGGLWFWDGKEFKRV